MIVLLVMGVFQFCLGISNVYIGPLGIRPKIFAFLYEGRVVDFVHNHDSNFEGNQEFIVRMFHVIIIMFGGSAEVNSGQHV